MPRFKHPKWYQKNWWAPREVTYSPPAVSSFYPPSVVMRDNGGLASSVLVDLGAIFWMGPQGQANPVVVITSLQTLTIEGQVSEANLEPETIVFPGLDHAPVVEVDSSSTSKNPCSGKSPGH